MAESFEVIIVIVFTKSWVKMLLYRKKLFQVSVNICTSNPQDNNNDNHEYNFLCKYSDYLLQYIYI